MGKAIKGYKQFIRKIQASEYKVCKKGKPRKGHIKLTEKVQALSN